MIKRLKHNNIIIKLVFGLALLFFIFWRIWNEPMLAEFDSIVFRENYVFLFLVFLFLMFLNWSLETVKWKYLMKDLKPMSFKSAFVSVLSGISTGMVTPNRFGNFIGRTVYFDTDIKTKATFLTFLSNLSQFTASVVMGLIGFEIYGRNQLPFDPSTIEITSILLVFCAIYIYLNPSVIRVKIFARFLNKNISEGIDFVQEINIVLKLKILLLSIFRYSVFVIQFFILLYIFKVEIDVIPLLAAISLVFLITTMIPSVFFGKLFVRESSAILVLGTIGISIPVILITVFLLWLVNLAIPSFFGAYYLIRK